MEGVWISAELSFVSSSRWIEEPKMLSVSTGRVLGGFPPYSPNVLSTLSHAAENVTAINYCVSIFLYQKFTNLT